MLSRSVPRHRCAVTLAALLVSMLAAGTVGAPGAAAQSASTVLICEATGNPAAPYVEIRVNQSDLGNYGAGEGDIIPAPAGGCPSNGGVAPVETSATATTTTTVATTTTVSSASTTSAVVHHKHKATTVVSSSSTALATVLATSEAAGFTEELAPVATLHALPRTGGQVPLTLALGLLALLGGGLLRWALVRRRAGGARH